MLPYEIPTKPWQHIATDIFQIRDKFNLLTVDLYSKYPLLEQLSSSVSSKQITEWLQNRDIMKINDQNKLQTLNQGGCRVAAVP